MKIPYDERFLILILMKDFFSFPHFLTGQSFFLWFYEMNITRCRFSSQSKVFFRKNSHKKSRIKLYTSSWSSQLGQMQYIYFLFRNSEHWAMNIYQGNKMINVDAVNLEVRIQKSSYSNNRWYYWKNSLLNIRQIFSVKRTQEMVHRLWRCNNIRTCQ